MDVAGQVVLVVAVLAAWLYTLVRMNSDEALAGSAKIVAFWALLAAPWLVLLYWMPKWSGRGPFFVGDIQAPAPSIEDEASP